MCPTKLTGFWHYLSADSIKSHRLRAQSHKTSPSHFRCQSQVEGASRASDQQRYPRHFHQVWFICENISQNSGKVYLEEIWRARLWKGALHGPTIPHIFTYSSTRKLSKLHAIHIFMEASSCTYAQSLTQWARERWGWNLQDSPWLGLSGDQPPSRSALRDASIEQKMLLVLWNLQGFLELWTRKGEGRPHVFN